MAASLRGQLLLWPAPSPPSTLDARTAVRLAHVLYMVYTWQVSQLNIHVTSSFERALHRFMKLRGITSKSEAVRVAVEEAAEREAAARKRVAFGELRGAALAAPPNPHPRFQGEDDLWG